MHNTQSYYTSIIIHTSNDLYQESCYTFKHIMRKVFYTSIYVHVYVLKGQTTRLQVVQCIYG